MRKRTASDKISCVKDLQSPQSLRKLITDDEWDAILKMFHDGFTVHDISETVTGVHCVEVALVVTEAIRKDAERCL